jgi:hypothetical protein
VTRATALVAPPADDLVCAGQALQPEVHKVEKQVRERSRRVSVERFKRTEPQFVISHAKPQPSIRTVTTYEVVWDVRRFFHPIVEHNLIAFCELIDRDADRFIKDQPGASDLPRLRSRNLQNDGQNEGAGEDVRVQKR